MAMSIQLKSATAIYNQPTLPHLLNEYGFISLEEEKLQKQKDKEKEDRRAARKLQRKETTFHHEEEKDKDKKMEHEAHYLKMVKDLYHLRDYYYNEYSSLLADKITKQRQQMKERDAKLENVRKKQEEEERQASHKVKKRLQRHTLDTTPATIHVPKTDLYHIIGLEDKLRKEGKLRTQSDYNTFRTNIKEPEVFYANFKVKKNTDESKYSETYSDYVSSYSHGESHDNLFEMLPDPSMSQKDKLRTLSRISESRESPHIITQPDNWAVTQQFPAKEKPSRRNRSNSFGLPPPTKPKTDQLSDLEKRFPKLEMPKLHCFTLNLEKKPPDPEEVRQNAELRAKEKSRKKMIRTYTKMYQLAMSNAATTARIMDNHEDLDLALDGPDLCDVIADHHWMKAYGLHQMPPEQHFLAIENNSQDMASIEEGDESKATSENRSLVEVPASEGGSRRSSAKSRASRSSKSSKSEEAQAPMPLTLAEVQNNCSIKESKTLSSLWSNYLLAGKSPWEPK